MKAVAFRRAKPSDIPALKALKGRAAWTNEADRPFLAANPDEAAAIDVLTLLVTILEENGEIRAFIGTDARAGDHTEIVELFTDPDHMRRGFARRLVQRAVDAATEAGQTQIIVDTNPASLPFYRALGFTNAPQNPEHAGITLNLPLL